jgi:hypothetical protein
MSIYNTPHMPLYAPDNRPGFDNLYFAYEGDSLRVNVGYTYGISANGAKVEAWLKNYGQGELACDIVQFPATLRIDKDASELVIDCAAPFFANMHYAYKKRYSIRWDLWLAFVEATQKAPPEKHQIYTSPDYEGGYLTAQDASGQIHLAFGYKGLYLPDAAALYKVAEAISNLADNISLGEAWGTK